MPKFEHILIPTDFGEASARAIDLGIDLATSLNAELTLLHVWEIPVYAYVDLAPMSVDYLTPIQEAATAQLQRALAGARARWPRTDSVLRSGIVWQEIISAIQELVPDLVIMGTHGRSGLNRALLGSVAEKVVRLSPVPVLTVGDSDKSGS